MPFGIIRIVVGVAVVVRPGSHAGFIFKSHVFLEVIQKVSKQV